MLANLVAGSNQFAFAVRINSPEATFAWFVLSTGHLHKVFVEAEIVANGILPAFARFGTIIWIMARDECINAGQCELFIGRRRYGLDNQLGVAVRWFFTFDGR